MPLEGIGAPRQFGVGTVGFGIENDHQSEIAATIPEHRHGVGLQVRIKTLQNNLRLGPVDEIGAFGAADLPDRVPQTGHAGVLAEFRAPKRVVVRVSLRIDLRTSRGMLPMQAIGRERHGHLVFPEEHLESPGGVGLAVIFEHSRPVRSDLDNVGEFPIILPDVHERFAPRQAIHGNGVANAHHAVVGTVGDRIALLGGCFGDGRVADERTVPALVEAVVAIVQDVGVQVVEPHFPRFVLAEERIARAFGNGRDGQLRVGCICDGAAVQDEAFPAAGRLCTQGSPRPRPQGAQSKHTAHRLQETATIHDDILTSAF